MTRAEINKIETKKAIEQINETRCWFLQNSIKLIVSPHLSRKKEKRLK